MSTEIVAFLVPQADAIQVVFFLLIFGFTVATIWSVNRTARPERWESNWCGGTIDDLSDDLDAEHGSVNDISHAVATTPEKLADVMPGILLVFGLLGTFLGLGMALNKASLILMEANSASGGMDQGMANLMGMMQGLGTKFKTSTWGIIAFLGLKAWISANGFEEKRLRWSVRKMKSEMDKSRSVELSREVAANRELISSIRQLGSDLCVTLQSEISENRNVLQRNQDLLDEKKTIASQTRAGIAALVKLAELQVRKHEQALDHSQATRSAIESFVNANASNIGSMKESASAMAVSASRVGESAADLKVVIQNFDEGVAEVLGRMKQDLGSTIEDMKLSFNSNMATISTSLVGATNDISTAVGNLSTNVERTMTEVKTSIGDSLTMQQRAFAVFDTTAETLNVKVQAMTGLIDKVCSSIESGLKAVSMSGRRMESLSSAYEGVTANAELAANEIRSLAGQIEKGVTQFGDPADRFGKVVAVLEQILAEIEVRETLLAQKLTDGLSRFDQPAGRLEKVVELLDGIRAAVGRDDLLPRIDIDSPIAVRA